MKDRFDEQLTEEFREKLGSIHASDDLIAKTLQRLAEEQATEEEDAEDVTLTAIDPGFITSHINHAKRHYNRIIMYIAAAVSLATIGGAVLISSQIKAKKNASADNLSSGTTITAVAVSGSSSESAGSAQLLRTEPENGSLPKKPASNAGYYGSRAVYSAYFRELPRI